MKEKDKLTLESITNLVTHAIADKRLEEKDKDQFVELGKKIGTEELEKTLKAMHPAVKLSSVIGHQGSTPTDEKKLTKLSDVPAEQIATLRSENLEEYTRLYKAEYGIECEI